MPTLKLEVLQEDIDAACKAREDEDFILSRCCIVSQAAKRQTGGYARTGFLYVAINDLFYRPLVDPRQLTRYTELSAEDWHKATPGTIYLWA